MASVTVGHDPTPACFDESHWSNIETMTQWGTKVWGGYLLAKTLAEKAAWDFQKSLKEEERFDLVTICPPYVYGPSLITGDYESGKDCIEYMHGKRLVKKGGTPMVSVLAVAQAHLNAIKIQETANNRFVVLNGTYTTKHIAEALSAEFAADGWVIPTEEVGDDNATNKFNNQLSKDLLKVEYEEDMGSVFVEMAHSMIATGALKKPE
jgi:nucleoside-diphosphate-sugar epimerase